MGSTHHEVFCLISATIIRATQARAVESDSINIFVQQKHHLIKIQNFMHK